MNPFSNIGLAELFETRAIKQAMIAEPVAVGSLEYAASHLHAKVLVVAIDDQYRLRLVTYEGVPLLGPIR